MLNLILIFGMLLSFGTGLAFVAGLEAAVWGKRSRPPASCLEWEHAWQYQELDNDASFMES